jgi:hypothetical protein
MIWGPGASITFKEVKVARQVQGAILLLTMLMTPIAWAADLDMVLAPPPDPVRGGAGGGDGSVPA